MFWIAWSRGVLQLLGFATTLLVARMLAPADYGVMALAAFWTGTIGMVAEMGLGAAIIQFRDLNRREIDTCFWITMILATAGFVALVAAAPMISRWFGVPRLADVLPILALVLPFTACRVVSDSLLRKRLALDRVSQAEVAGGVVTLPVMIGCTRGGLGVWTLVIGSLTGPAVRSIFTIAFAPWCPGFRVGGARVKEVIHFSLATLGVKLMWVLREWSNTLVIGKITGSVTLGLFSMAEELALLPGSKVSTVVNMLSSPIMAELQTNVDAMRAVFYRAARLTAAIALPTSTGKGWHWSPMRWWQLCSDRSGCPRFRSCVCSASMQRCGRSTFYFRRFSSQDIASGFCFGIVSPCYSWCPPPRYWEGYGMGRRGSSYFRPRYIAR